MKDGYKKSYRERRLESLRCACGKPKKEKVFYCDGCKEKIKIYKKERRETKKNNGLCPICGQPANNGKVNCKKCIDRENNRNKNLTNKGICYCGKASAIGRVRCKICLDKNKKRRSKNYRNGLCACGKKRFSDYSMCKNCFESYKKQKIKIKNKNKIIRTYLYRPTTKEEREKYGGATRRKIIKSYYEYLDGK